MSEKRRPNWEYDPRTPLDAIQNTSDKAVQVDLSKRWPNYVYREEVYQAEEVSKTSLIDIARCYSLVFRDEPWNEAFVDLSENFYGTEYDLSWRDAGFERAYPLVSTKNYIEQETSRSKGVLVTRNVERRVIAFGWGYGIDDPKSLVTEKWKDIKSADFQDVLDIINSSISSLRVWYLSEVGVLERNRKKGIASEIVSELISKAPKQQDIIMRTNAYSPMTVIAKNFKFKQILGPKTEPVGSEIIVNNSEVINLLDPVNPERVLYVLPKDVRKQ